MTGKRVVLADDLTPLLHAVAKLLEGSFEVVGMVSDGQAALDAVLALDRPGMLAGAFTLHEFAAGSRLGIGPFDALTCLLPHWVPNAGLRLAAAGTVLAYTGDSGPDPGITRLARDADLLLAEATYAGSVPPDAQAFLSSAAQAGTHAAQAGAALEDALALGDRHPRM